MTPEVFQMVEQLAAEQEDGNGASWDWTSAYRDWETFRDVDEEEEQQANEAERAASAAKRAAGGCSHDHRAEREVYELPIEQKLQRMERCHARGNALFVEGQFYRAATQYKSALVVYEYAFPDDDATWARLDRLRLVCNLNSAACNLKVGLLDEALSNCHQVLAVEPDNVKALFRRAQVQRRRHNYDQARADLVEALRQRPHDFQLREELLLLRQQVDAYRRKRKDMARQMMVTAASIAKPANPTHQPPSQAEIRQRLENQDKSVVKREPAAAPDSSGPIQLHASLHEPVLFDVPAIQELVASESSLLLGYAPATADHATSRGPPTREKAPIVKSAWIFEDLNRPGAFVRPPHMQARKDGTAGCECCPPLGQFP